MPTEPTSTKKNPNPNMKPHWFSYTQTTLGSNTICAVSVVLDAGAQENFSGIRVIVVRKERSNIDGVVLKQCFNTSLWSDLWRPSQMIYATHREAKADHKRSRVLSQRLIEDSLCLSQRLPLCTIVFELQDTGTDIDPSVTLTMRTDSRSDAHLRIIYDHAVTDHTLFVFLESNQFFRNIIPSIEAENSIYHTQYTGDDTHVVRVLPVSGSRKPFPHLPFKIIRHIAEEAFGHRYTGWRASLLSCALVCKLWYPLVDMFYDTLGSAIDNNRLIPRAVSNSLTRQPIKGRLIRRLDYRNFKPTPEDSGRMDFSEALISVLQMAICVKEVILCVMPSTLIPNLLDALGQLERVEIFTMYIGGFHHPIGGGTQYPNIVDTQRSIANWTKLRVLKLSSWDERGGMQSICQMPSKCRLEHLWLKDGSLTGTQLLWFASPYSKIRDLSLINIRGLSNSGLSAILHEISSTLGYLAITNSTVSRERVNETYALDDVMPKMTSLHTAHIHGDLLTSLSISTKQKMIDPPSPRFISIYRAPHMDDADRLIKAFETTGWDAIELASNNIVAWNDNMQDRAHRAAQDKGIRFMCSVDDGI